MGNPFELVMLKAEEGVLPLSLEQRGQTASRIAKAVLNFQDQLLEADSNTGSLCQVGGRLLHESLARGLAEKSRVFSSSLPTLTICSRWNVFVLYRRISPRQYSFFPASTTAFASALACAEVQMKMHEFPCLIFCIE